MDTLLPLVTPEVIRELLTNDLKSAAEYRAIKNLKTVDYSELNKLEVDVKSLQRWCRTEKRFCLEAILSTDKNHLIVDAIILLGDQEIFNLGDFVARLINSN